MKVNILSQEYYSDGISKKIVLYLQDHKEDLKLENAVLYYHYPLFRELDEELEYPNLFLISPLHGIIIIQGEGKERVNEEELQELDKRLSRIDDLVFSKLLKSRSKKIKKGKRKLSIELYPLLIVPNLKEEIKDEIELDNELILNFSVLKSFLKESECEEIPKKILDEIFSIIEGASAIIKPKKREGVEANTKAFFLEKLEDEIAKFDETQKYAALSQLNGPQRIRGLAGSGKTIILAMKVALLHLKYPEKKILYTFMTKSLYDYTKYLIKRFFRSLSDLPEPNWDNVHVKHGWGGNSLPGVYYDTCKNNNITPLNLTTAKKYSGNPFDYVCQELLRNKKGKLDKEYDYILIDEAQDFKPSFYQMCRELVRNDCLVWAYDELQNIFNIEIQNTINTFQNDYGASGIDLSSLQLEYPEMDNDIVLSKCYRNPKEILVTSLAVGFGTYSSNNIQVQTLENNEHWKDLGYHVEQGNCKEGEEMVISRSASNSPLSISKYQNFDEIIQMYKAENLDEEIEWIVSSIKKDIHIEKLRPDDIVVICMDDKYAKSYFNKLAEKLYAEKIYVHNIYSNPYEKGFKEDGCITLTSVYKAKGNEAPKIYAIGSDVFSKGNNDRKSRNKFFTAFTRAKAWLAITGVGENVEILFNEVKKVKENDLKLIFTYQSIHTIMRDLSEENAKATIMREMFQSSFKKAEEKGISEEEFRENLSAYLAEGEEK